MSLKVCILVKRLSLKLKLAAAQINWHDVSQMQNQSFSFLETCKQINSYSLKTSAVQTLL